MTKFSLSLRSFAEVNKPFYEKACTKTCYSPQCSFEADHYKSIMNLEIDPCENFYDFVCAKYQESRSDFADIRDSYLFHDARMKMRDELFEEILSVQESDLRAFKSLKAAYLNCIDESILLEKNLEPLKRIVDSIGGWPILMGNKWDETKFSWSETVSKISNITKMFFPFCIDVQIDYRGYEKFMLVIQAASAITSDPITPEYLSTKAGSQYRLKHYEFIHESAVALGADNDNTDITEEIQQLVEFDIKLISMKNLRRYADRERHLTVRELSHRYPSIPWLRLLQREFRASSGLSIIDGDDSVFLIDPHFFLKLEALLAVTPKRVLANYLTWKVVSSALFSTASSWNRLIKSSRKDSNFELDKDKWCRLEITSAKGLDVSVSSLYARKYFNERVQGDVTEIFKNIKHQMMKRFARTEWLDKASWAAAVEKIAAMDAIIGYDDELLDDGKIEDYYASLKIESDEPYYKNALNLRLFEARQNYKRLKQSVEPNFWLLHEKSSTINGFQIPDKNRVFLSIALINTLFKADRPEYLNYGQLGASTGHEIVHGFDSNHINVDKKGHPIHWLQPEAEKKFNAITRCFVEQYNNYTFYNTNLRTNGVLTLDENICDNGGFKAAYNAYVDLVRENNIEESCLPSLPLTPRQMFWVSSASMWCRHFSSEEALRDTIIRDNHSPAQARINVAFSNMKEFAEDFNCKVGTKMNPARKCVLW